MLLFLKGHHNRRYPADGISTDTENSGTLPGPGLRHAGILEVGRWGGVGSLLVARTV